MSKSPSLRRIQADIRELALDPSDQYHAAPLEEDMFEWHFTIRGATGTEFEGGVYHGRILLPPEYPFKPPHIVFLTPSGRFETGTKICLSFSAYHPELWQPAWGIRLILEALISFLPAPADGAIGALDWTKEERKRLAKKSVSYCCPKCGVASRLLPKLGSTNSSSKPKYQDEIKKLYEMQVQNETKQEKKEETEKEEVVSPPDEKLPAANTVSPPEKNKDNEKIEENEIKEKKPEDKLVDKSKEKSEEKKETKPPVESPTHDRDEMSPHWMTDPLIHGSIVTFAAIIFLLYRKVESLLDELKSLDEEY